MKKLVKFTQMIKQAFISLVTDDSTAYPQGQAGYNNKTTDYVRLSPYGLDSNPPAGSFILLLSSQSQEAVKFGVQSDFINRFKNLKAGEVALYNTLTQSVIHLKENGDIEIDCKNNLIGTVAGTATLTVTGNTTITTPLLTLNGDLQVNGDIDATGTITGDTEVTTGSINLGTHVHTGVQTGGSNTGGPV
jgi:phage baseplate assembly protein V